jgi:hypothetical protein
VGILKKAALAKLRIMAKTEATPTPAVVNAAADQMRDDEAIAWENQTRQLDYLFHLAAVIKADEFIVASAVQVSDSHVMDDEKMTPYSKLLSYEKAVHTFELQKQKNTAGKAMTPPLRNPEVKLVRMKTLLEKLDQAVLAYDRGKEHEDLARKIGWMGYARWAEWCRLQKPAFVARLASCREKYEKICRSFLRHPDTPGVPKSWPVAACSATQPEAIDAGAQ